MQILVQLLKRRSQSVQLSSFGHGWIELPNGQHWQPAPGVKVGVHARRVSLISRIFQKGDKRDH